MPMALVSGKRPLVHLREFLLENASTFFAPSDRLHSMPVDVFRVLAEDDHVDLLRRLHR
jgi:hypothetical protein